ncbi:MAG: bifunctional diaminohydroxyphosphoribosylaminopyrimidine deaminase/5-amino-6-(5-phosphoribosylamino)uracil reductase RibD [Bacteroidales bacterium]|nr:bifunctional diaminohydroxyphosphoribosylaminopyrimidine deaminase/5-amino-6-(5-phosphoribosylamino)uracil reductase RibD [Bacteroidales bacterium]
MASEEEYMRLCIELARKGMGYVAPNPMVGAVIVCNGEVIGSGYHQKFGEAHAEVNAIASVENKALLKQSTMYVNLEPCSHYGKMPPCALAIAEAGIPRVVIGNKDPFAKVNGSGMELLKDKGVEVLCGVLERECKDLNKRFFTFHTKRRPYITLKWAQSADGFVDGKRISADDEPIQISNEETKIDLHRMRAEETAILVGTTTAMLDNPRLTVRYCEGPSPVRILIDRLLKIPTTYHLFDGTVRTIVFTEQEDAEPMPNVTYKKINFSDNPFRQVLDALYDENLISLIVEGGTATHNSFLRQNLWDEIRVETNEALQIDEGILAPHVPSSKMVSEKKFGNNVIRRYLNEG